MALPWVMFTSDPWYCIHTQTSLLPTHTRDWEWLGWFEGPFALCTFCQKEKKLTHQNQFSDFEGTPFKNNGQGKDWWLLKVFGIGHQMVPECAWACPFFQNFRGGCAPFEPLLIVQGGLAPPPLRYPCGYHFKGIFFYLRHCCSIPGTSQIYLLQKLVGAPGPHRSLVIEIWLSGPQRVKRIFLTKFELSALTFVKIVKIPPSLWVQKSAKPYSFGCRKTGSFPGHICGDLKYWTPPPNPPIYTRKWNTFGRNWDFFFFCSIFF